MGRKSLNDYVRIAGFDFGTKCGYSVIESGGAGVSVLEFGTWVLPDSSQADNGFRMLKFERFLQELLGRVRPTAGAFEKVSSHRRPGQKSDNTQAAHVYGGFKGIFEKECKRLEIPHRGYSVATIKKVATGYGGSKKAKVEKLDVQKALSDRFGCKFVESKDDESDALAVAVAMAVDLGLTTIYLEYARRQGWIV